LTGQLFLGYRYVQHQCLDCPPEPKGSAGISLFGGCRDFPPLRTPFADVPIAAVLSLAVLLTAALVIAFTLLHRLDTRLEAPMPHDPGHHCGTRSATGSA